MRSIIAYAGLPCLRYHDKGCGRLDELAVRLGWNVGCGPLILDNGTDAISVVSLGEPDSDQRRGEL